MAYQKKSLLKMINKELGLGNVYFIKRVRRPLWKDAEHYYVEGIPSLIKLIKRFDKFPLIVKRKDYVLWKRAIVKFQRKEHLTKKGFFEIVNIRDQMNRPIVRQGYSKKELAELIRKYYKNGY